MPKDIDIGIEYLRKAAEQGHSKAQYSLGVMYAQGEKVKQDFSKAAEWFSKAAEWFSKAAEQGNGSAQLKLAYMYQDGEGVPRSYEKFFEWYQKAAEHGTADMQYEVGAIYNDGKENV